MADPVVAVSLALGTGVFCPIVAFCLRGLEMRGACVGMLVCTEGEGVTCFFVNVLWEVCEHTGTARLTCLCQCVGDAMKYPQYCIGNVLVPSKKGGMHRLKNQHLYLASTAHPIPTVCLLI